MSRGDRLAWTLLPFGLVEEQKVTAGPPYMCSDRKKREVEGNELDYMVR